MTMGQEPGWPLHPVRDADGWYKRKKKKWFIKGLFSVKSLWDATSRLLNNLFSISIWREISCQTHSSLDKTLNYMDSKVTVERRNSCCLFHVSLCGCQLSMEGKRRKSMHDRLKIASVGSVIFSRSGNEGLHVALRAAWSVQGGDWQSKKCVDEGDKSVGESW